MTDLSIPVVFQMAPLPASLAVAQIDLVAAGLSRAVALVSIFFAGREDSVPGVVAAILHRHVVRHSDWRIRLRLQSVPRFG